MNRILIVDDHSIVREGFRRLIEREFSEVFIGEAENGEDALKLLGEGEWTLLVLDMNLPDQEGLQLLMKIKGIFPDLPVLVLTMHSEVRYAMRVMNLGAAGFICKDEASELLAKGIRKIIGGEKFISEAMSSYFLEATFNQSEDGTPKLSNREFQVLKLISEGVTASEIAEKLSLSVKTVNTYRSRILQKLGLKGNADIVKYAIENKII